jgi:hypothetical protein
MEYILSQLKSETVINIMLVDDVDINSSYRNYTLIPNINAYVRKTKHIDLKKTIIYKFVNGEFFHKYITNEDLLLDFPRRFHGTLPNILAEDLFITKLLWKKDPEYRVDFLGAQDQAKNGNLPFVKWYLDKVFYSKSEVNSIIGGAINGGQLEVLKYIIKNNIGKVSYEDIGYIVEYGHFTLIKWLWDEGICANNESTKAAAKNGHLNILKWLLMMGVELDQNGIELAAINGHLKTTKWIYYTLNKAPKDRGFTGAAFHEKLDVLKWLYKNISHFEDTDPIRWASSNIRFDTLEWLWEKGFRTNIDNVRIVDKRFLIWYENKMNL